MQPVSLTIHGDYWDSFIYKGRLYLWAYSEELTVYNWDLIIDFLEDKYSIPHYREALNFAFKDGRTFYEQYPEEKKPFLRELLIKLSELKFDLSKEELSKFECLSMGNPFPELPTDIEIFNDVIYGGTDLGLIQVRIQNSLFNFGIDSEIQKIWSETEVIRLKANYGGRIALSTGPDGLFEFRIGDYFDYKDSWSHVSNGHSSFADWNFTSIYNSSDEGNSFLALYEKIDSVNKAKERNLNIVTVKNALDNRVNIFHKANVFSQNELFHLNGNTMSWGNGNKIYLWNGNQILKTDFFQYKVNINVQPSDIIGQIEIIKLNKSYEQEIVSAGVTYFGIIVELESCLLIIYQDDNDVIQHEISADITKWRAFPRSVKYENQIHVVTENSLQILSVNSDYFNSQQQKKLGMRYFTPKV